MVRALPRPPRGSAAAATACAPRGTAARSPTSPLRHTTGRSEDPPFELKCVGLVREGDSVWRCGVGTRPVGGAVGRCVAAWSVTRSARGGRPGPLLLGAAAGVACTQPNSSTHFRSSVSTRTRLTGSADFFPSIPAPRSRKSRRRCSASTGTRRAPLHPPAPPRRPLPRTAALPSAAPRSPGRPKRKSPTLTLQLLRMEPKSLHIHPSDVSLDTIA